MRPHNTTSQPTHPHSRANRATRTPLNASATKQVQQPNTYTLTGNARTPYPRANAANRTANRDEHDRANGRACRVPKLIQFGLLRAHIQ